MPTDATQYLLAIDTHEFIQSMSELQASYEMFSKGVQSTSDEINVSLSNIESKIVNISSALDSSYSKLNNFYSVFHSKLKDSAGLFADIDQNAKSLHQQLKSMGTLDFANSPANPQGSAQGDGFSFSIQGSGSSVEELQKALATSEIVSSAAKKAIAESKKAEETWKKSAKKIGDYLVTEVSNAKSRIKSIISSFGMGALGVGVMGLMGSMVLGFQEGQRKGAERGELANVMESAGGLFEKTARDAVGWASRFQEVAQFKYGIGRKEIQSVFDVIVKGGHAAELRMSKFNKKVSDVNANILAQSIAMDKAFNLSAGTTVSKAVKYVEDFGGTLDNALDKLRMLSYEAQGSGMSMDKFVNSVLAGSSSLMQYRVDMGEVASVMRGIKKVYEDLGIDEAQAGAMAAKATEGVGGILDRMPEGVRQAFAIQYFAKKGMDLRGKGYEADVRLKESWSKTGEGSSEILMEVIKYINEEAGAISRDYYGKVTVMEKSFGLDSMQSQAFAKYYESNISPEGLKNMTPEQEKQWKATYDIEGSQLTQIQKNQRDLINGLAKVGEGMLSLTANILATIVLGIRTIPALVSTAAVVVNPLSKKDEIRNAMNVLSDIGGTQRGFFDDMSKSVDKTTAGFLQVANALGETLDIVDSTKNIKKAATVSVGPVNWTSVLDGVKTNTSAIGTLFESSAAQQNLLASLQGNINQLSNDVTHALGIISKKEYNEQTLQNEQDFIKKTKGIQGEAASSSLRKNKSAFQGTGGSTKTNFELSAVHIRQALQKSEAVSPK